MYSCETCTMFGYKTSLILRKNPNTFINHSARFLRNSYKFRCLLDQLVPKFAVLSSLSSVFTSGNVIALAATASSGSVHGAVTVAITDVAVTAVAIASGACLSTKVDFLWPKVEEQPGSLILDGVDVTDYPIFSDSKVQKAVAFARRAHQGQFRKTGDPYLTHCIHTAKILVVLVPSTGKRVLGLTLWLDLEELEGHGEDRFFSKDERKEMEKLVIQNGGSYSAELNKKCTHLVCDVTNTKLPRDGVTFILLPENGLTSLFLEKHVLMRKHMLSRLQLPVLQSFP